MPLLREIKDWWPRLPETTRQWFIENPRQPLTPDVFTALVQTRGYGVPIVHWVEAGPPAAAQLFLDDDEYDWIEEVGSTPER